MLKLKLQYFGHLMQRTDSLEKTLMLERLKTGGEGDNRGWDGCKASPTQWTWVWVSSWSWWWTWRPGMLQSMGWQRVGHNWVNRTELMATHKTWKRARNSVKKVYKKYLPYSRPIFHPCYEIMTCFFSWSLFTLYNCGNFWTVVLEKTLESPLDCRDIQPVHPRANQSWIFIGSIYWYTLIPSTTVVTQSFKGF